VLGKCRRGLLIARWSRLAKSTSRRWTLSLTNASKALPALRSRRLYQIAHIHQTNKCVTSIASRNAIAFQTLPCTPNPEENFMRTMCYGLLAVAAIAIATPASAQLRIETPVGGVRVGTDRDRDYDRPRYQGTTGYGERSYDRGCRTITVRRDDGSVRRIRRCD